MSSSRSSASNDENRAVANVLAAVLIGAADAVRSWSDEDVAAFLSGDRELIIRAPRRTTRSSPASTAAAARRAEEVRSALNAMHSREAGIAHLEQLGLKREELRALVSALDLPTNRSDNVERLRSRIVESLIGYRLRSQAIRGETGDAALPSPRPSKPGG
jgi:hypothetical protein